MCEPPQTRRKSKERRDAGSWEGSNYVCDLGALTRECQQPQSSRPEGCQLIKEEDDRRAKTTGGKQIKGSAGLARGVKHFLLLMKFSPNSYGSKWDGGVGFWGVGIKSLGREMRTILEAN